MASGLSVKSRVEALGSAGASRMPNVGWKHIHAHQRGEASLLRVRKESWKQGYKGRGPYIGPISRMGTIKMVKLILIRQVKARSGWLGMGMEKGGER